MARELAKKQREGDGAVAERTRNAATYTPRFDIVETESELLLYGDLPGVSRTTWRLISRTTTCPSKAKWSLGMPGTTSSTANMASAIFTAASPSPRPSTRKDSAELAMAC